MRGSPQKRPDVGIPGELGLTQASSVSWQAGVELIDGIAHHPSGRFSRVLITPPLDSWILVAGPWCGLPYLNRTADSEYPELALGEPFGLERRSLDAIGITGRPEDLDPDEATDLLADWDCPAPAVARELSLNPAEISAAAGPATVLVIATPPETQLTDPFAHTAGSPRV